MTDFGPARRRAPLAAWLMAALWLLGLARLALPWPALTWLAAGVLALHVAVTLVRGGWPIRLISAALAAATIALGVRFGVWAAIPAGLAKAVIFAAFLSTIVLLRATAERRPEVALARRLFATLDRGHRSGGLLIGGHVLGSVLIVGVFAVLAPILAPDADDGERRAAVLVTLRGFSLAVLWSPFFVATAVANQHLPGVPLWQIMPVGLALAALGLVLSYLAFDRGGGLGGLGRALATLRPIVPPVAAAALLVATMTALTPLSTLNTLVVFMPALCVAALASSGGGRLREALADTFAGLGRVGPELCILTFAMILGVAFEAALAGTGALSWLAALALPPGGIVAVVIGVMIAAGFLAIHPIVTGTVLLVLFTGFPTGVADLVLMEAVLIGWGLGTLNSLGSVSFATASAMYRIAPVRLIAAENLLFVVVFATLSVFILDGLNRIVVG